MLIACVAIGAWATFGASVRKALSKTDGQFEGLGDRALSEGSTGREGSQDPTARGGQAQSAPLDSRSGDTRIGDTRSGDTRSGGAGTARRSEGGASRPATATGAGRALPAGSGIEMNPRESSGVPAQGVVFGAREGLLPGGVVAPAAPPAVPLPASAGRVVASAAKEPSVLLRGTDIATDFIPYVSNVKDATVAITGVNPVTGEEVGTFGRVAAGVFAIPGAGNLIKYVGKGGKYVLKGGKVAYEAVQASRAASKAAKAVKAAELAATAAKAAEREVAQGLAKQAEQRLAKEAAAAAAAAASRKLGTEANQAVFWSDIRGRDEAAAAWVQQHFTTCISSLLTTSSASIPSSPSRPYRLSPTVTRTTIADA